MSLGYKFVLRTNEEKDVGIFKPKIINFNLLNPRLSLLMEKQLTVYLKYFLKMHQAYLVQI